MSTQLLPAALARAKSSQFLTIFIPAGGRENIKATGSRFYVKESAGTIRAKLDQGAAADYSQGCGISLVEGAFFENVELYNPGTYDLTVKVYVGFGDYIDQRAEVLEPPTEFVAGPGGQIAGFAAVTIAPAITGRRIRRKSLTISNGSAQSRLMVQDAGGNNALILFPGYNITLPLSGPVVVKNPQGDAVEYYSSETYWVTGE